jgi:hypothetical protein
MDHERALDHVHASNLTRGAKQTVTQWYRGIMNYGSASMAPVGSIKSHLTHQVGAVRQGAGSLATGAFLGIANAELPHGLDSIGTHKLPIDGVGGAIALLGGAALAAHGTGFGLGNDIRNAGATALGIYGFRKGHDFHAERKLRIGRRAPGGARPVAHGEDPILAAAADL